MGLGKEPECSSCKVKESDIWHKKDDEQVMCIKCHEESLKGSSTVINVNEDQEINANHQTHIEDNKKNIFMNQDSDPPKSIKDDEEGDGDKDKDFSRSCDKKESKRKTRKGKQAGKGNFLKGKGRRIIFKKSATKAPSAVSTPTTSNFLFHQGTYYQLGDIVSVIDVDGDTYYAQIRGLLQDQYCEKSAVLTWILPTKNSPPPEKCFDPSTYIIGPDEEIPRKLEFLSFVCHAPSDYYKDRFSPYATVDYKPESCYIWSKLGPIIKPIEESGGIPTK